MKKKTANPALIGGFIIGAVVLLLIAVLLFGTGTLFTETGEYVTFFDGSVAGLNVGSAVLFRGVPIGSVSDITMLVEHRESLDLAIAVVLQLERGKVKVATGPSDLVRPMNETMAALIEKGLRSKLVTESLVTGQLLVELDFHPKAGAEYLAPTDFPLPEIPSVPSDFEAIRGALNEFSNRISQLPIEEIFTRVASTLENIDTILESENLANILSGTDALINSEDTQLLTRDLRGTIAKVDATLDDARSLLHTTDEQIEPMVAKVDLLLEQLTATATDARTVLSRVSTLTGDDSELIYRANQTMQEVEAAMRSLRTLLDYLEQNPEALLRGKKSP